MKWILFILMASCMIVPTKRALFIFQQNRYETGRYRTWIEDNLKRLVKENRFYILLIPVNAILNLVVRGIVADVVLIVSLVITTFMAGFIEKYRTYIKPLVCTARVKRQIAVLVMLEFLWTLALILSDASFLYYASAWLAPWLLIWPVAGITAPIEAAVRNRYLNEAKQILAKDSSLIRIGITGSFGKTTTKNIMQAMVSEKYNSLMTPASYNTPMGITRTIREMLKPIHQVFVCEMGADHVGDIAELMDFVHPVIGVVTSIGPQHLNTFGSQENITREKMKMIEMLPADGFGVLNYDNSFIRNYQIRNHVKVVTYGIHSTDVDYRARDITYTSTGSEFTVVCKEGSYHLETKLLGELNILNILSAVAVARHLNISWEEIAVAVSQMKQVEHRLQLKRINGYRFIDDAFNANPTGSKMALEVLGMMPGRRIIVTPGMIDLGEKQSEINYQFGTYMKGKADTVILVGKIQTEPIWRGLKDSGYDMKSVLVVDRVQEAFHYVYTNATVEDTILLENDLPDAFNH